MQELGIQFIHIDLHALQKCGQRQTVHAVLAEANRQPDACLHVSSPQPPILIFGIPINQLRDDHDRQHSKALAEMYNGKQRKIREDQLTMMSCVTSCKVTYAQMKADRILALAVRDWVVRVKEWLKSKYGKQLKTIVMHLDEAYVHLHAYILPADNQMRAKELHPGEAAKLSCKAAAIANGDTKKIANRKGDLDYRQAMREFQDDYSLNVGLPAGQTRVGPKRLRRTREEWRTEQGQANLWRVANQSLIDRERELQEKIEEHKKTLGRFEADHKLQQWRENTGANYPLE